MLKKKISILLIFIFLNACGYSPIYSNLEKKNINIQIIKINGDSEINKSLVRNLERYKNSNSEKSFKINIVSEYKKLVLSKNAAGVVTNYRLNSNITFEIISEKEIKKIIFKEKFDIKKGDSLFEENNYENIIKRDMAMNIAEKLILQLMK